MIFFPGCKINIGLRVVGKRADGYHNLETVMFPVRGLCDAVEIIHSRTVGVEFTSSGLPVCGSVRGNLCVRAYEQVRSAYPIGGVKIHLHKRVPMGAGLGGGSSDAACVIKGLSQLFGLGLSISTMEALAAEIGSDTAFFIADRPALATGRGDVLTPCDLSLGSYHLVIVKPDISVSTAEAYERVSLHEPGISLKEKVKLPVEHWRGEILNDFEESVFPRYPQIAQIKRSLYDFGALYASMSGSGSAVYGIFPQGHELPAKPFEHAFVYREDIH